MVLGGQCMILLMNLNNRIIEEAQTFDDKERE